MATSGTSPPSAEPFVGRRAFVTSAAAAAVALTVGDRARGEAGGARSDLRTVDLELPADDGARKVRILVPAHGKPGDRFPAVVLLHGLGETRSQALGLRAWSDFYGLAQAYGSLRRPPLARPGGGRYLTDSHRAALDASLGATPFGGLVCICPVTPNARKAEDPAAALDRYADWIEKVLLPEAGKHAPLAGPLGLDGVSLGGWVAFEVFTRKAHLFRTLGGVQAAIGPERSAEYGERLAKAVKSRGPTPLHLETSTDDPFREANELLCRELAARSVASELAVLPGPHDQAWLREVGTLAMLRWHERKLRS